MKFRSRVSIVLVLFLVAIMGVSIYQAYCELEIRAVVILVLTLVLVCSTIFGISYTIDGTTLYVSSFPLWRGMAYDLTKLVSISPTRSLLSSPAASFRRLKLDFGVGKSLIISPAAQELFIEEIQRINPKVKVNL